jgi:predicted ester cyclase
MHIAYTMTSVTVTRQDLEECYQAYIATLNAEDWASLPKYLAESVNHNGKTLDYSGYRDLIPAETHFIVADLVVDTEKRQVASRLDITVAGKQLTEHCFYRFNEAMEIERVWSLVQDGQVTG